MINISTHALTWSATLSLFLFIRFLAISTHALTWSATLLSYALTPTNEFQLTHSRGVRRISIPDDFFPVKFQLTHSRGVRLGEYAVMWNKRNFNSRTHVECDLD